MLPAGHKVSIKQHVGHLRGEGDAVGRCDCLFVSFFKLLNNASVNIDHQPD